MKLYKFRPLGSKTDFERVKRILNTGEFWCSRFFELNDPMEGIFMAPTLSFVKDIFKLKQQYMICSLSGFTAFENPVMWGYYANGFKGIAIEIEVDNNNSKIEPITYYNDLDEIQIIDKNTEINKIKSILLSKLKCWEHENEYRFLKNLDERDNDNSPHIGKITAVYFGNPFGDSAIKAEIYQNNQALQCYQCYANLLKNTIEDIQYYEIKVVGNKVEKVIH